MRGKWIEENSGSYFQERPTSISNEVSIDGTGVKNAIWVGSGAYVTRVSILNTSAGKCSCSTTFTVGDGLDPNMYLDAMVSLATGAIVTAPNMKTATDVATYPAVFTNQVGGKRYNVADTIDVTITNSRSDRSGAGSIRVLAWYYY